jgi:hypothetical protein
MTPTGDAKAGKPFARVEPMEQAVEHGMPYYKLLAANMVVTDGFSEEELTEMAERLSVAHLAGVREAVKERLEKVDQEAYSALCKGIDMGSGREWENGIQYVRGIVRQLMAEEGL